MLLFRCFGGEFSSFRVDFSGTEAFLNWKLALWEFWFEFFRGLWERESVRYRVHSSLRRLSRFSKFRRSVILGELNGEVSLHV